MAALKAVTKEEALLGGLHSTMDSVRASHPAALGSILGVPKDSLVFDVAEINQLRTA